MNAIKTITLRLTPDLHKKLKLLAIQNDTTIQEMLTDFIEKSVDKIEKNTK